MQESDLRPPRASRSIPEQSLRLSTPASAEEPHEVHELVARVGSSKLSKLTDKAASFGDIKLDDDVLDALAGINSQFRTPTHASTGVPRLRFFDKFLSRRPGDGRYAPVDRSKLDVLEQLLPQRPRGPEKGTKRGERREKDAKVQGDREYLTWSEIIELRRIMHRTWARDGRVAAQRELKEQLPEWGLRKLRTPFQRASHVNLSENASAGKVPRAFYVLHKCCQSVLSPTESASKVL